MSKIDNTQKTLSTLIATAKANGLEELANVMNKYKTHLKNPEDSPNPLKPKVVRPQASNGPLEVTFEEAGDRVAMRTPFIPKGQWKAMYSACRNALETCKYDPKAKAITVEPQEIEDLQETLTHFFGEGAKEAGLEGREVIFQA